MENYSLGGEGVDQKFVFFLCLFMEFLVIKIHISIFKTFPFTSR